MSDRITVIRAPRDSDHQYMALARSVPQDSRLSFEARGLLAYLLSKPSDWIVRREDLQREGKCGRDRIYRLLNELTKYGYLHRERVHREDGTFEWGPHRVYEIPFTEKAEMVPEEQEADQPLPEKAEMAPFPENPYPENPYPDNPYTENPHIYKEEKSTDQRILHGDGGGDTLTKKKGSSNLPRHVQYLTVKGVGAAKMFTPCDPDATIELYDLMRAAGIGNGAIVDSWKLNPPTPERVKQFQEEIHAKDQSQRLQRDQGRTPRPPRPGERGYTGRH